MTEAISLFRDRDILDELGLGSIRDWALADFFFPGLSTVQTRARYFLFVPWIYQSIERAETPAGQVRARFRALHTELVSSLERGEAGGGGIIGVQARERTRILSNSLYWRGLGLYGIRHFNGTIDAYEKSLDRYRRRKEEAPRFEPGEFISTGPSSNWDPGLPPAPDKFLRKTSFELTLQEAAYLKDRITHNAPQSLLAHLLERNEPVTDTEAPWMHPDLAEFPAHLQSILFHARAFALLSQGAVGLYRLMLSEALQQQEWTDAHRDGLLEWGVTIDQELGALRAWDLGAFWHLVRSVNPNVSLSAELFVTRWTRLVLDQGGAAIDSADARSLITVREAALKRSMARLTNKAALATWNGAPVARPFPYRWRSARLIIDDILKPLMDEPQNETSNA